MVVPREVMDDPFCSNVRVLLLEVYVTVDMFS